MAKLVTIYGGSGFLGRQVAANMARRGWRIRIAVRRPDEALFTRTFGAVGQVAPVLCNIRDDASVYAAMDSADAVINCVGLSVETGKNTFDAVDNDGAARIARIAAERGIAQLVHISAIGADPDSDCRQLAAKGRGDAAVVVARPDAVILRPSFMFGDGDNSYTKFARKTKMFSLILLIAGGGTKMQPAFVDDVAEAAALAATGAAAPGIYELGGPEVLTIDQMVRETLVAVQRRRGIFDMPGWLARFLGGAMDLGQTITGGLFTNRIMTRDYARLVAHDRIVAPGAPGFADFGIAPVAPQAVIDDYLWRFRPSGQYDAIKNSAKNLRHS